MDSTPLHPAVVHLPLGLAFVMPFVMAALGFALWRGWLPRRSWLVAVVLQALLFAGGLVALETGENDEEQVERVMAERPIEDHEEKAEIFLWASGIALAVSVAVLVLPEGAVLAVGAAVATAAALVVLGSGYYVGHSGGELVYVHGAADAYVQGKNTLRGGAHDDH